MTGIGGQYSGVDLGIVSNVWQINEIGDINADNKSDIVWRATDGHVFIWELTGNGGQYAGVDLGLVATSWHLV